MESYILRIYRRGRGKAGALVGVIEGAEDGTHRAFHNEGELVELLRDKTGRGKPASTRRKSPAAEGDAKKS